MENYIEDLYKEKRNFRRGLYIALILTAALTFIEIWQLILIPGVVAGLLNKKMRRGIKSGAIGVTTVWIIYILIALFTKNSYILIDQFAGLIFGGLGYGWIFLIIIILLGALFGALGGAIGSGISQLLSLRERRIEENAPEFKKSNNKKESN